MAEIEDTPPATQPLPTLPSTRPLPAQATPATLPDPADLRPAGPNRRWTWLLGGITAGAGTAALVLGLVANLVTPTTTAATTPTATATPASSGPATPSTAPYTAVVAGCALLRPETVDRYAKGAACTEQKPVGGATSATGGWDSRTSGLTTVQVWVTLSPLADRVYQQTLSSDRTLAATAGMKITDDHAVPGLGEKATLLYTTISGFGHVDLVVLQRNALITIRYEAHTLSGFTLKDIPPTDAEAAATACAQDALATLTTS
ncbi:hypothetical protein [Kitasatospora sp. NPDC096140]|uniref:hypothetical protein n=1 Tax=Kitasatospora sp. NPDC096140 TaxID=3155425 RepID=UPI003333F97B